MKNQGGKDGPSGMPEERIRDGLKEHVNIQWGGQKAAEDHSLEENRGTLMIIYIIINIKKLIYILILQRFSGSLKAREPLKNIKFMYILSVCANIYIYSQGMSSFFSIKYQVLTDCTTGAPPHSFLNCRLPHQGSTLASCTKSRFVQPSC